MTNEEMVDRLGYGHSESCEWRDLNPCDCGWQGVSDALLAEVRAQARAPLLEAIRQHRQAVETTHGGETHDVALWALLEDEP